MLIRMVMLRDVVYFMYIICKYIHIYIYKYIYIHVWVCVFSASPELTLSMLPLCLHPVSVHIGFHHDHSNGDATRRRPVHSRCLRPDGRIRTRAADHLPQPAA